MWVSARVRVKREEKKERRNERGGKREEERERRKERGGKREVEK